MRPRPRYAAAVAACLALATGGPALADDSAATGITGAATEPAAAEAAAKGAVTLWSEGDRAALAEIVVEAKRPLSAASSEEIRARDFDLRPHSTVQEVLQNVPGLVVSQHQGGGKAMQYLIRGFDADHGTDFAIFVDGVPVNLVSHAHGQGYADLSYVIPETIDRLKLWKGPYFAQFGDFMSAGALEVETRDAVAESSFLLEGASFDTARFLAQASPQLPGDTKLYLAAQAYTTNGPFENPQSMWSYNFFGKLTLRPTLDSTLRLSTFVYDADWDASGEIPLRAVTGFYPDGMPFTGPRLDRFGSIDPTEGGRTDYEALNLRYTLTPTPEDTVDLQAYGFRYRLALWSDFTFFRFTGFRFLRDQEGDVIDTGDAPPIPGASYIPGDGIEQDDQRWTYGVKARWTRIGELLDVPVQARLGVENRNDSIDLGLWRQTRRQRFFAVNEVHVDESSVSGWSDLQLIPTGWLRFEAGLRGDVFFMSGRNRLPAQAPDPNFESVLIQGSESSGIVSPKANVILGPFRGTDVFLNFGTGFHSNDARVALLAPDFAPLTRSIGAELGARTSQLDGRLDAATALWWLDLDSELVFSGDSGVVDAEIDDPTGSFVPGAASRRWGIDFELRYRFTDWLWLDYDLGYADPRFRSSGLAVPLAPTLLMNGGLTARFESGFEAGMRFRFVGNRPANEDRTLTAEGYFVMDILASYRWRNVQLSLALLNATDQEWREAQFADDTCLANELGTQPGCLPKPGLVPGDGVSDVHFTPGNPIGVRGGIQVFF